ncbi:hypothetical protein GYMLUDRAFT_250181 [Collybiopsis luxurians FD-317 M1]|uniref:Uncharacterized protein n=1 Tax=Collybiopsis luxurians FD-317 M1 TaxID=944289 RepID=A0A0D0ATD1_9AGAR|nr:hypothetical protein GYMLUDRAFT_250181 [Collybiopsis luxurians FD-317 M1]
MFSMQNPITGTLQYPGLSINAHGSDTYIAYRNAPLPATFLTWAQFDPSPPLDGDHTQHNGTSSELNGTITLFVGDRVRSVEMHIDFIGLLYPNLSVTPHGSLR